MQCINKVAKESDWTISLWERVRGQVYNQRLGLADFLTKNANANVPHWPNANAWNLYVDESSTKNGNGARLILETPHGEKQEHTLKFMLKALNDEVEYEALIASVELYYIADANSTHANLNSKLVISQLNGKYEVKDEMRAAHVRWLSEVTSHLTHFQIIHIPLSESCKVNALSKLSKSLADGKPKGIHWLDRSLAWMDPILTYWANVTLLSNPKAAERVKKKGEWSILYDGILYEHSYARVYIVHEDDWED